MALAKRASLHARSRPTVEAPTSPPGDPTPPAEPLDETRRVWLAQALEALSTKLAVG